VESEWEKGGYEREQGKAVVWMTKEKVLKFGSGQRRRNKGGKPKRVATGESLVV